MKKQKILVLFIVAFLAVVGLGFYLSQKSPALEQRAQRSFLVAPPPNISFVPNAPINVVFSVDPSASVSIPESLPVYSVQPNNPDGLVRSFASSIKAPSSKTTQKGVLTTEIWNSETLSMSYSSSPSVSTLSFSSSVGVFPSGPLNNEEIGKAFVDFVLGKNASSHYRVRSITNVSPESGLYSSNQPITVIGFERVVDGVSVLVVNFDPISISVSVANSAVVGASIAFPPQVIIQTTKETLPSLESVVQSLNNNLGLLISSYDSKNDAFGANPVFDRVTISSVSPVYYYDEVALRFLPSFIIEGVGVSNNKEQFVRYFLFASRGQQQYE